MAFKIGEENVAYHAPFRNECDIDTLQL